MVQVLLPWNNKEMILNTQYFYLLNIAFPDVSTEHGCGGTMVAGPLV